MVFGNPLEVHDIVADAAGVTTALLFRTLFEERYDR